MVYFRDRRDAGRQLGYLLKKYEEEKPIILALPRGGVEVADEIAKALNAPLDLLFAHKIGHPLQPEYAIGAVSEGGLVIGDMEGFPDSWLQGEIKKQKMEMKKRRELYLGNKNQPDLKGKAVILVDDGIATGLTMRAGILEVKSHQVGKLIVASPVMPMSVYRNLSSLADLVVGVNIPEDSKYLGAVGAYFAEFPQSEDSVIQEILAH